LKMNYFVVGTNDIEAATSFYDSLFRETGVNKIVPEGRMTVWGTEDFMFAVAEPYNGEAATSGNGAMVGFNVGSPEEVKSLYGKALELGGVDEGEPSIRSGRFSAYVRDLDKNKICFFE
jgi:predicted lactoylglutathione lyase